MTLWELACYFAVFLGGAAGGWITCAVFTAARVNELNSEVAQLWQKLREAQALRDRADEASSRAHLELYFLRDRFRSVLEPESRTGSNPGA